MDMVTITLRKGRERPILRGHPWIFSGAIATMPAAAAGDLCDILDSRGTFLARGYLHPGATIRCRVLTRKQEAIDEGFFTTRIEHALGLRQSCLLSDVTGYRLVNGEGDLLPGLVVDRYGDGLCCQFLTAGMDRRKEMIVAALQRLLKPAFIYERSEGNIRNEDRLENQGGALAGTLPEQVEISENGRRFLVDIRHGQKTGFYMDQRDNRTLFGSLAHGRRVLNTFAYTGGFGIAAALGGAKEVVNVESSASASALAQENFTLNGLTDFPGEILTGDVFAYLREETQPFDLIVLDPPPFARHRRDVDSAARGYKEINMQALRKLAPGGLLLTCSCSQHVSAELFQQIVFGAAVDIGRDVTILQTLAHAPDHPVSVYHREGAYLKAHLLRV